MGKLSELLAALQWVSLARRMDIVTENEAERLWRLINRDILKILRREYRRD